MASSSSGVGFRGVSIPGRGRVALDNVPSQHGYERRAVDHESSDVAPARRLLRDDADRGEED